MIVFFVSFSLKYLQICCKCREDLSCWNDPSRTFQMCWYNWLCVNISCANYIWTSGWAKDIINGIVVSFIYGKSVFLKIPYNFKKIYVYILSALSENHAFQIYDGEGKGVNIVVAAENNMLKRIDYHYIVAVAIRIKACVLLVGKNWREGAAN